ncbi:hypothetical protein FRB91_011526 [Serendipita sp. 411]|nr:hypothetical protein FRB91_011526 [Serendipita sp. 411]
MTSTDAPLPRTASTPIQQDPQDPHSQQDGNVTSSGAAVAPTLRTKYMQPVTTMERKLSDRIGVPGTFGALSALLKQIVSNVHLVHYASDLLPFLEETPKMSNIEASWRKTEEIVADDSDDKCGATDKGLKALFFSSWCVYGPANIGCIISTSDAVWLDIERYNGEGDHGHSRHWENGKVQYQGPAKVSNAIQEIETVHIAQEVTRSMLILFQNIEQEHPVDQSGYRPSLGCVQRILQSSDLERGSGLFDIRRRQCLRRVSGGHEKQSSSQGSGTQDLGPIEDNNQSVHSNGSRGHHSEGSHGSGDDDQLVERGNLAPMLPNSKEALRIGNLWYLRVHTGDERFRWIKCTSVLFRSQLQLQLTWVEAGGGKPIIRLDLLNYHEFRSMPYINMG